MNSPRIVINEQSGIDTRSAYVTNVGWTDEARRAALVARRLSTRATQASAKVMHHTAISSFQTGENIARSAVTYGNRGDQAFRQVLHHQAADSHNYSASAHELRAVLGVNTIAHNEAAQAHREAAAAHIKAANMVDNVSEARIAY